MNAFRSVGNILWEDSARFWGADALLEQGRHILELLERPGGEGGGLYERAFRPLPGKYAVKTAHARFFLPGVKLFAFSVRI